MTVLTITAILLGLGALFWGVKYLRRRRQRRRVEKRLSDVTCKLTGFVYELEQYRDHPEPVKGIVSFFAFTAAWHDRVDDIEQVVNDCRELDIHPQAVSYLEELTSVICTYGRQEYGMNRTRPGEQVTEDDVYLGDTHGCWTEPVSSLMEKKETLQAEVHTDNGEQDKITVWDCYAQQAESLMNAAVKSIGESTRNASLAVGRR